MKLKEREIGLILKEMHVGEPYRFTTAQAGKVIEVDRVFKGVKEAWVIRFDGNEIVMKDFQAAVKYIAKRSGSEFRRIIDKQFSELEEIIDLGEF